MRMIFLAAAAASMAVPMIPAPAVAHSGSYYKGKVWRDSEGRYRCKRSNGTTGLVVGALGDVRLPEQLAGVLGLLHALG